jgi:DNA-directed RNA polymerase I, II, and III subunit RPABC3
MDLVLDVNSELYPVNVNEKIRLVLTRSLSLTGSTGESDGYYDASRHGPNTTRSLADDYDYVMFGKCYKFDSPSGAASAEGNRV